MKKEIQFHIIIAARINLKKQLYDYTLLNTEIYNLLLDTHTILLLFSYDVTRVCIMQGKRRKKKESYHNTYSKVLNFDINRE